MPKPILPQPKGWFVYCYLRTRSNKPYYVGLGSRPDRMTARHSCKVPNDWTRIRVLRQALTREEAQHWEIFYIQRFGRRDLGTGFLVNRKEGGDCGGNLSPELLARLSEATKKNPPPPPTAEQRKKRAQKRMANQAAKYGIPIATYQAMRKPEREKAKAWCLANPERPFSECPPGTMDARVARTAERRGVPVALWSQLSLKERNALRLWLEYNPDHTAADYLAGVRKRPGPSRRIDRDEVLALHREGRTNVEIASLVECSPPHVCKILKGMRSAA